MSAGLRRLLVGLLAVEVAVCGWLLGRRALRMPPPLPAAFPDDPLLEPEMQAVADAADRGGAVEWRELGESLLGQGLYADAEQAFARAAALDPRDIDALFGQAFCVDRTGRVAESIAIYRRCLDLPDVADGPLGRRPFALYAIGRNHLRLGDVAAAEAAFRENDGFVPANFQLAKLLYRDGRLGEAVRIVEQLLGQLPLALELHQLKARILDAAGAPAEAFAARAAEERSAHLVESNFNTDYVRPFTQRHGIPRAFADYEQILPPLPGDPQRDPARLEARLRPLEDAVGKLRIPQRVTLAYLRADLAAAAGRTDELADSLRTIAAAGDGSVSRLELEARLRELEGDTAAARDLLGRAAAMGPTAQLHRRLAEAAERDGNEAAARQHRAREHFYRGKAIYRRNELETARREFEEASRLDPTHVASWYRLGEMAYHLGRPVEAVAAFRRVLELEPDHERAATFLRILEPAAG